MEKYVLSDRLKVRREGFGGVVLIIERQSVRFFNEFGYEVMKALRVPRTVGEVMDLVAEEYEISAVSEKEVAGFIQDLLAKNICKATSEEAASTAQFYFDDVRDFDDDYFYAPLGVEIEYTNKCARQCDYCSYFSNPFVDVNTEMPLENWIKALDDVVASGVFYVRFTGGDPFMRPELMEAVRYADDLGLMVSIGSDLTVTKEEHYAQMAELKNFVFLQTTLDGATAETCNRFRGKGNYRKVIKGMEMMQKYNVPFIVGTVLTRHNYEEIGEIGRITAKYGTKGYCFSPLYIAGRGIGMEDDIPTNEQLHIANSQFRELVEGGVIRPADSAWEEIAQELPEEEFKSMLDDQSHLTRTGERLIRIDPKGHVYVSVKLKRLLVEQEEEWNAGNIMDGKLLDIWQGSDNLNSWRGFRQEENTFGKTIDTRVPQ